MTPPTSRLRLWPTRRHQAGLLILLAIWAGVLVYLYFHRPARLGETPGVDVQRVDQVRERIDPNTASAASLQRLPMVGPEHAAAIIRYREAHGSASRPAFRYVEDLDAVRGLGPETVRRMAEFTNLPSRVAPATVPQPDSR
jgi:competence ComEA-like helix-hairpin-helix protein